MQRRPSGLPWASSRCRPSASSDTAPRYNPSLLMGIDLGSEVSHFRLEALLGAGGMGEVYLAEDVHLKRKVALKFLNGAAAANPDSLRRFLREAQAASALDHPNLAGIHEIGEWQGLPFLALAYLSRRNPKAPHRARSAVDCGNREHPAPGGRRPGERTRSWHRPSRLEAGQHHGGPGRPCTGSWISASQRSWPLTARPPVD